MRNRVRDLRSLQVALQLKDIVADRIRSRDAAASEIPQTRICSLHGSLREIGGDLFADKGARPITDLQATLDRIVVGNGDVIHPRFEQLAMQFLRIGIAVRKIETTEEPFFRARAVARMNMKIALAHIYIPRLNLCSAIQSW